MLKICPHFLRGRVRESFNFALRERFKARLEGNVEVETRAWKLFGLIPIMLLQNGTDGRERMVGSRLWPTDFGQNRLWPKPILAKPTLAKTDFGQTNFGQNRLRLVFVCACVWLCVFVCVCLCVCVFVCFWFHGFRVGVSLFGHVRCPRDRPSRDRPKFRSFFSLVPTANSFFFSLSFGLFRGARSGGAAGVSHDSLRAQTGTFEGPGLQKHHQNSTRRHPKEGRKRTKTVAGEGKKRAKLWAVQRRGGPVEGP